jgi:putative DNA primase/helicase
MIDRKTWTPPPRRATVLATAEWSLSIGAWPVAITPIDSKGPSPGKKPLGGDDWGAVRQDLDWFKATLKRHPGAGLGWKLGPEGGVIDLDVDDARLAALQLSRMFRGEPPPTLGWRNSGGRYHLLFLWDDRLTPFAEAKGVIKEGTHYRGLELRLGGASKQIQSVIPPSLLANAARRVWNEHADILPLPESVFEDLEKHLTPPRKRRTAQPSGNGRAGHVSGFAAAAVEKECAAVATTPKPGRNDRLNVAAYNLGQIVGAGELAEDQVEAALRAAAEAAGLGDGETARTIRSGMEAGKANPRDLAHVGNRGGDRAGGRIWGKEPPKNGTDHVVEAKPPDVNEAPDDPHRLARVVLARFKDPEGSPTLAHYQGMFHAWNGTAYRPNPHFTTKEVIDAIKEELDRQNVAALAAFEEDALAGPSRGRAAARPVAKKVTTGLVRDVLQALAAMCSVDREQGCPFWITPRDGDPDPRDVIPTRNGLLDIGGDRPALRPHTARFFSTHCTGYDFDPDAPAPARWHTFLRDQWPDDQESIDALHEQLGDMLAPDTRIHALFLWIGPPRSGRGTMRDVAYEMIGRENVTSCSPASLGEKFGLESFLGKKLAVMGDARAGDSHDSAVMMDRLLRITGGDPVEVNRKNKSMLPDVRLNVRGLVITNEMPNFRDASGAIVARYHVLATTRTIPVEDRNPRLAEELKAELPGILNEAIRGLKRLRARGRFLQPASAAHLLDDAEDIASPIKVFVAEKGYDIGKGAAISKSEMYEDWKRWAVESGYQAGNDGTFGKNLKAAFPSVRKTRPRDEDNKQTAEYEGIGYFPDTIRPPPTIRPPSMIRPSS